MKWRITNGKRETKSLDWKPWDRLVSWCGGEPLTFRTTCSLNSRQYFGFPRSASWCLMN